MVDHERLTEDVDGVDVEDLEGPIIDRRTTLKMLSVAGLSTGLAGCSGDGGDGGSGGDGGDGGSGGDGGDGGSGDDGTPEPTSDKYGGRLQLGVNNDAFNQLHPFVSTLTYEFIVTHNVMAHLWKMNQDYEVYGEIAKNWEYVEPDTLRIEMYEDVTMNKPFEKNITSEDVKFSMNLFGETDKSPRQSQRNNWIDDIETPDDYTVVINHPETFAPFIPIVASRQDIGQVLTEEAWDEKGFDGYNRMPVGAGAFRITNREEADSFTLEANENYHLTDDDIPGLEGDGNQLPFLEGIDAKFLPEGATLFSALRSGDIDAAARLPAELFPQADEEDALQAYGAMNGGFGGLGLMCNNPAEIAEEHPEWVRIPGYYEDPGEFKDWDPVTSDVRVRRAIAHAIDRESLIERATFGLSEESHNIWCSTMGPDYWSDDETGSPTRDEPGQVYDPEKAEELLDEAGYTGEPRLELDMLAESVERRVAVVLQEQLSQVGIDVNLNVQDSGSFWPEIYSFNHTLQLFSQAGQADPWQAVYRQFAIPEEGTQKGVWQKYLWFDEEMTEMAENINAAPYKSDERREIISGIEDRFLNDDLGHPVALAFESFVPLAQQNYVNDIENPYGYNRYHYAWTDK
jgi:peptide/nickel transport system substrate-binding protein